MHFHTFLLKNLLLFFKETESPPLKGEKNILQLKISISHYSFYHKYLCTLELANSRFGVVFIMRPPKPLQSLGILLPIMKLREKMHLIQFLSTPHTHTHWQTEKQNV